MPRHPTTRFQLHEATRKRLVRSLILALGVLPMVVLGLLSLGYWSPYYQAHLKKDWESRVAANLGVRVLAGQFTVLAPEQFVAQDVVLFHPETDTPMAKIRKVAGWIQSQGWSIALEAPQLDASQLESVFELLHDGFLCKPQTRERMLAISVPQGLEVHHNGGVTQFRQVEILMKPTENRSSIVSKFSYVDQPFGEIQVQVVRDHAPGNLATRIEVRSPKTWIACSNFSDRLKVLQAFGPNSQFRGLIQAQWSPQGWDAIVQGDLDRVQFADLTSPVGSPFKGIGGVSLSQLNLRDGRILYAQGKLDCQQGALKTDWIRKASQWLQLPSKWEAQLSPSQTIDAMSVGFELSPEGLRLSGQLPGPSQWPPVAIQLGQATVCTPKQAIPMTSLVAALQAVPGLESSPEGAVDLNAMQLASILPWPSKNPLLDDRSGTENVPEGPESVTRLSEHQSGFERPIR
ncbi:MAG: hypothetical protein LW720_07995 [Pirellula sp.]|nr:hypothetical protein [Pirellula sp.]